MEKKNRNIFLLNESFTKMVGGVTWEGGRGAVWWGWEGKTTNFSRRDYNNKVHAYKKKTLRDGRTKKQNYKRRR